MRRETVSTIQKREKLNDVFRCGEPGPGGAYHKYVISDRMPIGTDIFAHFNTEIAFQNGPRKEFNSRHGVCDHDLLEIVRDRLTCFMFGDMPSYETDRALQHVEEALMWLNKRTEDRIERNVLGTYNK